jgi:eukaryotic translation initiation factor 2C
MAAITMSWDSLACRYAAAVQTNGYRVEMLTPGNIRTTFMQLYERWVETVTAGKGPEHIYYFRDGVSEGQYLQVLEQEVKEMKNAIAKKFPEHKVKFPVIFSQALLKSID